jgi:hypothetical protein
MPTFLGRRYARRIEAVGPTERTVGIVILLLTAGLLVALIVDVATRRGCWQARRPPYPQDQESASAPLASERSPDDASAHNPLAEIALAGWQAPRRVERFTAGNLYVKIDGRADAYIKFGVVGLTFGRYNHESDTERTVDVYWYDMGNADSALEMYQSERPADATPVLIEQGGAQSGSFAPPTGYQVGGAIFFCRGASYVQVLAGGVNEADAQAALAIATRLAERIEGK